MDLVDIDQVLDNLELREAADENKILVARGDAAGTARNGLHGPLPTLSATATAAAATSNTNSNANSYSKSFVGVSQVFNSLDDYRKNVESLESAAVRHYDEDCKLIDSVEQASRQQPEVASDVEQSPAQPTTTLVTDGAARPCKLHGFNNGVAIKHDSEDEDYDEDDDDDDVSNDIQRFREAPTGFKIYGDDTDPQNLLTTTSSGSITTSSSSSFSSGPSPGFASTTEDLSTPLSPVDAAIETMADDAVQPTLEEIAVAPPLPSVDSTKATGLEELAVGLSSISINSQANSQSELAPNITVSSALGGLLEELSANTTTSLISQMRDVVNDETKQRREFETNESKSSILSTSSSSSPAFSDVDSMKEPEEPEEELENKLCVAEKPAAPPTMPLAAAIVKDKPHALPQLQQPVTFGSTMDEISDTELDSMLQEMDIDDVADDDERNQPSIKMEAEAEVHATTDVAASTDYLNADNFSQASTVEFSELKMQQANKEMHSAASSYTSSESSLEDEQRPEHQRPERPKTLNLPLQGNMYANAGQTPPGNSLAQSDGEPDSFQTEFTDEVVAQQLPGSNENMEYTAQPPVMADSNADAEDTLVGADIAEATGYSDPHANLGKIPPIWVPDNMATACMQCHAKFTMIKRRHHCRACGKVLCSVCCSQKFKLQFLADPESRVCVQCFLILTHRQQDELGATAPQDTGSNDDEDSESPSDSTAAEANRSPNPNNPMEYCSTIPPHRQVSNAAYVPPPSVIVPVGVLKKDGGGGSNSSNSSTSSNKQARKRKSVMFSDGIAPGSDLASMENQWSDAKHARRQQKSEKQRQNSQKTPSSTAASSTSDASTLGLVAQLFRGSIPPTAAAAAVTAATQTASSPATKMPPNKSSAAVPKATTAIVARDKRLPPSGSDEHGCFIPAGDHCLPPIVISKGDNSCEFDYKDVTNDLALVDRLQRETLKFALQKNFYVYVKIVNLSCCMNKTVINFTTCGMHQVGNDELIILLEYETRTAEVAPSPPIPKDIFVHLHELYVEAAQKCNPLAELSFSSPQQSNFLGSREYGGFLYIRATFQCLQDIIVPESPFLVGVLIHRYEVPWAKVFPLRLMLRLGAQYRYYPCPHVSMRDREPVYAEIAQTIINFLADFRNYSYTLPSIKGLYIHMEDRQTSVLIPRNRHDDVIKAINNASDHILAFGGNFSKAADGHLVCIQNTSDASAEMYSYSTQAINIQGQPRKVTGASFFVLNEALKSSSGLSGKCSIVEDGLMVQILPTKMEEVRNALRHTKDIDIVCGPVDADELHTEIVSIKWVADDHDFGNGVKSPIDAQSLEGVSGMRVHASFNYSNANYAIRLTEIYMMKCADWNSRLQANDITRIAEQIARSTSVALLPFLDLLAANGSYKIGLRATLHQENVCYEAGTRGAKLPPLYMNALDNHLIPTLHNESTGIEDAIVLELIFYILNA